MTFQLKLTASAFAEVVRRLSLNPRRTIVCPAGTSRFSGFTELLVHATVLGAEAGREVTAAVHFGGAVSPAEMREQMQRLPESHPSRALNAYAVVGTGGAAGRLAGGVRHGLSRAPLASIAIAGAGLPVAQLHANDTPADASAWSRSIGALGDAAFHRLRALRFCIFGCGRSGSLFANALWRFGVRRLTLVDPDTLELANVGEMDCVRVEDVGLPKVDALAIGFRVQTPEESPPLAALQESAESLAASAAAKQADILVSCVDNPSARLLAAWTAKLYLKPLLDVGTGIFYTQSAARRLGGDVRLVLPDRCLLCWGGIAGSSGAVRAGSLRSLNGIAVGIACRLLEGLAGGRVEESRWVRLDFDAGDVPTIENPRPEPDRRCALCRFTGHGDQAIGTLAGLSRSWR